LAAGLLLGITGAPRRGLAREGVDSTAHFRSWPGTRRLSHLALSATEPRYRWVVGLMYNYNRAPITGGDAGLIGTRNLISDQHLGELQLIVGLPYVDVGLAFPLVINQEGEPWTAPDGTPRKRITAPAVGDLRLHAKVNLINPLRYNVGLAAAVSVTAPTGQVDRWAANPGVVLDGRLVLDYWIGRTAVFVVNVGYVFRSHTERLADLRIDDALEVSGGVRISFADFGLPFSLWGEIVAATQIDDPFGSRSGSPLEGRFGVRIWNTRSFFIQVGWGVAILRGSGLPRYRALVDVGLTFETPGSRPFRKDHPDRDDDGIPNAQDRCPDRAEDYDRFEDADGCPEDASATAPRADRRRFRRGRSTPWWRRWRWKRGASRRRKERARPRPRKKRPQPDPQVRPRPRALFPPHPRRPAHPKDSLRERVKRLKERFERIGRHVRKAARRVRRSARRIERAVSHRRRRPRPRPRVRSKPRPRPSRRSGARPRPRQRRRPRARPKPRPRSRPRR
jgi:hypothetical protein